MCFDCIKHGEYMAKYVGNGIPTTSCAVVRLYQGQKAALRIAVAISEWFTLSKLTVIWSNKSIMKLTTIRLLGALVWPVAAYRAEAWTYRTEEWKRWLAFETTGYRRVTEISWEAKKTNDEILQKVGGRQLPGIAYCGILDNWWRKMARLRI